MSIPDHVYLAQCDDGIKIGITRDINKRWPELRCLWRVRELIDIRYVGANALLIEHILRRILWSKVCRGRETFNCDEDTAIAALEQAIDRVASGDILSIDAWKIPKMYRERREIIGMLAGENGPPLAFLQHRDHVETYYKVKIPPRTIYHRFTRAKG